MDFTVTLFVNGEEVSSAAGDVAVAFSSATVLLGQASRDSAAADAYFDEASVVRAETELLGNGGFESALAGSGNTTPLTFGNFRAYNGPGGLVSAPVRAGAQSARCVIPGGSNGQNRYYYQDLELEPGEFFDFAVAAYPVAGREEGRIMFDWDRDEGAVSGTASMVWTPSALTFQAWGIGGSVDPIPFGAWTDLLLRIDTVPQEMTIGQVVI